MRPCQHTPSSHHRVRYWPNEVGSTRASRARPSPTSTSALRGQDAEPANDAANLIATRSPVSLCVALEAIRRAAKLKTLEDVLRQEYRTSCSALRSHDLVEGIRAQVIDKDRKPKWSPPSLAQVTEANVEEYFKAADPDLTFE